MTGGIKRAIIKRMMKAFERIPRADDYHLNEIFRHESFTKANEQERENIMLKSSEWAYRDESQNHRFESYFNFNFPDSLKDKKALDLGCFTGGRAAAWAERWRLHKIYGIDTEDVFIDAARNFARRKGVNAEFVRSRGEKLPFSDGMFDAVLSYDVFEHVQDLKQVLLECYRVLKARGRLFLVFPSFYGLADHHLGLVTIAPFIHILFNKNDIITAYNEIIDERGEDGKWYRRRRRELEPWEKGNTINGTTAAGFARLVKGMKWRIAAKNDIPILGGMSRRYPLLRPLHYAISPLARLPLLKECLSTRIIYILEKR
jgi:ubiquinone/menaquinone biosynthesis C-methylase UbiE